MYIGIGTEQWIFRYALCHILGKVRVANHAQSRRIDQVNVPVHQFGKRGFRSARDEIAQ